MAGAATFAARLYCWLWMGVAAHVPVMVRGRSVLVAALVATRWCGASAVVVAGRRVGGSGGGFLLVKISRNSTKIATITIATSIITNVVVRGTRTSIMKIRNSNPSYTVETYPRPRPKSNTNDNGQVLLRQLLNQGQLSVGQIADDDPARTSGFLPIPKP